MKLLKCMAVLYVLIVGTILVRHEIKHQAAQDIEQHDYRAAQLQLELIQIQINAGMKGPGHDL